MEIILFRSTKIKASVYNDLSLSLLAYSTCLETMLLLSSRRLSIGRPKMFRIVQIPILPYFSIMSLLIICFLLHTSPQAFFCFLTIMSQKLHERAACRNWPIMPSSQCFLISCAICLSFNYMYSAKHWHKNS
jgi:hypothetical protein